MKEKTAKKQKTWSGCQHKHYVYHSCHTFCQHFCLQFDFCNYKASLNAWIGAYLMQCRHVDVTVKIKHTGSWLYSSCLHFKKMQSNFKGQCKRRKGRMSLSLTHPSLLLFFITEEAQNSFSILCIWYMFWKRTQTWRDEIGFQKKIKKQPLHREILKESPLAYTWRTARKQEDNPKHILNA